MIVKGEPRKLEEKPLCVTKRSRLAFVIFSEEASFSSLLAAMFHGRDNEIVLHYKEHFSSV